MRTSALLCVAALVATVMFPSAVVGVDVASNILEVNTAVAMHDIVAAYDFVAVAFVAPEEHNLTASIEFAHRWNEVAEAVAKEGIKVQLARWDVDGSPDDLSRFNVVGVPAIKMWKKEDIDTFINYGGSTASAEEIVDYLREHTTSPVTTLTTEAEAADLLAKKGISVLAYIPTIEAEEYKNLTRAAEHLRDEVAFGFTTDRTLIADAPAECSSSFLVLRKPHKNGVYTFCERFMISKLKKWVSESSLPFVPNFNSDARSRCDKVWKNMENPHLLFIVEDPTEEAVMADLVKLANANEKLAFFLATVPENTTSPKAVPRNTRVLMGDLGIKADAKFPLMYVLDVPNRARHLQESIDVTEVAKLVDTYKAGSLPKFYKSTDAPAKNNGLVKELTANNWQELVTDNKKSVAAFFCIRKQPACDEIEKTVLKAVGKKFKDDAEVDIAYMDVQRNDLPTTDVTRPEVMPSLTFIFADKEKKPATFSLSKGTKEDSLIEFIEMNLGRIEFDFKKKPEGLEENAPHEEL